MRKRFDAPLAPGEVALVGAGPGPVELLTLAARRLLAECDAVVYDALVSSEVLQCVAKGAVRVFAGKRGGRPSARQEDITNTLIRLARENKRVVRLKGGDPLVFARGGEEARALTAAGIPVRIVPGITAATAAAAWAGIPLTDRTTNAMLALLTAREAGQSRIDWRALVQAFPVMVFYMAAMGLPELATRLLEAGMAGSTPLAVVQRLGWAQERLIEASLDRAASGAIRAEPPALVIVGEVVRLRAGGLV